MPTDYLEKCAAEGTGCDCVNVCKYAPSPPSSPVVSKSDKQAEFFRLAADMAQEADPMLARPDLDDDGPGVAGMKIRVELAVPDHLALLSRDGLQALISLERLGLVITRIDPVSGPPNPPEVRRLRELLVPPILQPAPSHPDLPPASPPTVVAREGIYEAGHYVEGLQRDLRLVKAQIAEMESSPTASPSVEERLRDLEKAVVYVARLIEDTLPPSHAGLHAWLERPAVRAARGLEPSGARSGP